MRRSDRLLKFLIGCYVVTLGVFVVATVSATINVMETPESQRTIITISNGDNISAMAAPTWMLYVLLITVCAIATLICLDKLLALYEEYREDSEDFYDEMTQS